MSRLKNGEFLVKRRKAQADRSLIIGNKTRAVKNEFVLPARAVDVNEAEPCGCGMSYDSAFPLTCLTRFVGARVTGNKDLGAHRFSFLSDVRVPEVFTDAKADFDAFDRYDRCVVARRKDAGLVKHTVLWKMLLAAKGLDAACSEDRNAVKAMSLCDFRHADQDP